MHNNHQSEQSRLHRNSILHLTVDALPVERSQYIPVHCNAATTSISNSMSTTSPPGATRWVGRVLADEANRPKPGSRDGPAYFAVLTLFGSWPFVKTNFRLDLSCVVSGAYGIQTRVFRGGLLARRGLRTRNRVLTTMP